MNLEKNIKFISSCLSINGDKYDYSLVEYVNNKTKVKIACKIHGIFEQTPNNHLSKKQSCPKCSKYHFNKLSNIEFVENSIKIHGNLYDYSMSDYLGNKIKVKIVCKTHGIFEQTPNNHISKCQNCPKCVNIDTNKFIEKCKKIHFDRYDYSIVNYTNARSMIKIICKKHGQFEQRASSHLEGVGCPVCKNSKGEKIINDFLVLNNINFIYQKKFENCINKKPLPFDFYLPDSNTCIEYNGYQHYSPVKFYGGEDGFKKRVNNDITKKVFCKSNNIRLIEIKYNEDILKILKYEKF